MASILQVSYHLIIDMAFEIDKLNIALSHSNTGPDDKSNGQLVLDRYAKELPRNQFGSKGRRLMQASKKHKYHTYIALAGK
jgi:hypothetical protein